MLPHVDGRPAGPHTRQVTTLPGRRLCAAVNTAWLLAAILLAAPAAVQAQPAFVQGGYGIDVRRFSGEPGGHVFDASAGTLTVGGAAFLTPRVSAGAELELGIESLAEERVTFTVAGRPETITTTYGGRRRSVAALLGLHTAPAGTVRAGVYAGLAFTAFRREIAADAPPIVLTEPAPPTVFTDYTVAPVLGLDVAAHLSAAVAIVGTVRVQGLELTGELRGFSLRPGAAVRVSF